MSSRVRSASLLMLAVASAACLGADFGGGSGGTAVMDPPTCPTEKCNCAAYEAPSPATVPVPATPATCPTFDADCNRWVRDLRLTTRSVRNENDPEHVRLFEVVHHAAMKTARIANVRDLRAAVMNLPQFRIDPGTRDAIVQTIDNLRNFRGEFDGRTYSDSKAMDSAASRLFKIIFDLTA